MLKKLFKKSLVIMLTVMLGITILPLNIFAASDKGPTISNAKIAVVNGDKKGELYLLNSILEFTANGTNGEGIKTMTAQWNNGEKMSWDGFNQIYLKLKAGKLTIGATDTAGNYSERSFTFNTTGTWRDFDDNKAPAISVPLESGTYDMYTNGKLSEIPVYVTDTGSGVNQIVYCYDGFDGVKVLNVPSDYYDKNNVKAGIYFPNKAGTYTFHVYAVDNQYNYSEVVTREFTVTDGESTDFEKPDYPENPAYNGFGAWLRAKKIYTGSDVVLNNHVGNGTTVEYIVEFYNHGVATNGTIDINLTIPNDAKFVSATNGGTAKTVNGQLVVSWKLPALKADQTGKLRATITYGPDSTANPTKEIYPVMVASAGSTELSRSGLMHLYINPNTMATVYHTAIAVGDNFGYLNAEMNVTRAEFAQMLYNAGLIRRNANPTSYLRYTDAYLFDDGRISYAKNAVSALVEDGLAIGDNYGRYNPYQPITYGEIQTIVAKIIAKDKEIYGINANLRPLFILQQGLAGWWESFEAELVRLNVNESTPTNSTSYISRREILKQLNRALMRGPVVENHLTVPTVKDLPRSDRDYLDLVEATVTHYAAYDSNLREIWK